MFKTAKRMGIKTVAVYSDADRNAKHVKMADEAVYIGPSPSAQSYLRADKIVEACRKTGADAVHPGYGFLSENWRFAETLEKEGIIWCGPGKYAREAMGDKIGSKKGGEMQFWTKDEYLRFSEAVMDKPLSFHAFELLYWTGIRCGELLALTPSDFMLESSRLRINKSYQSLHGVDTVTDPKTPKSVRTIVMPAFLRDEMADFIELRDDVAPDERLFAVTKHFLAHEMERGCKASGVKRIRIHDIRHSHVSLLIEMGFSALAIAERMGHEAVDITYRYAHLFPTKQDEMAAALDGARG